METGGHGLIRSAAMRPMNLHRNTERKIGPAAEDTAGNRTLTSPVPQSRTGDDLHRDHRN
jgi:hypothetical protein